MHTIKVHDKVFRLMISETELLGIIDGLASRLNRDYKDCRKPPVLICMMNGAMMFTAELAKRLTFDVEMTSIKCSSYDGMTTTGKATVKAIGLPDISGRRVILCEDLIETGISIRDTVKFLQQFNPEDIQTCVMLFKPEIFHMELIKEGLVEASADEQTIKSFEPRYYGKTIGNAFIVGFGLDYNQLGRNFKDIYVLDE